MNGQSKQQGKLSRRDFLKGTAGLAATGLLGAALSGCTSGDTEATPTPAAGGIYQAGTYHATVKGIGEVTVSMTFDTERITEVKVDVSNETDGIGSVIGEDMANAILEAQSAEVDTIANATVSSKAVKQAAENCIAQAKGEAVTSFPEPEAPVSENDWLGEEPEIKDSDVYAEVTADVVVVGLGLAGVAAARRAGELGATVIGIEKSAAPNCRSGEFAVLNSPRLNERWPERAFTQAEVDEIVDSHMNESSYRVKRSIMKKWADNIGEAFDWWTDADPELFIADATRQAIEDEHADNFLVPIFRPLPSWTDEAGKVHEYNWREERFPCYPTSVEFLPSQAVCFDKNWQAAVNTGKVEGYFGHFAQKLIMDNGVCVGVYAYNDDPNSADQGKYVKINARKGVILSTGDYGSNDAMMTHFAPDVMKSHKNNRLFTSFDVNGLPTNQGDGIQLGVRVGAKVQGYHAPMIHHMGGGADLSGVGVMGNAGFLNLDMDGKRFMNEDLPGQQLENQVEQVRLMTSWQFFDAQWPEQLPHFPAAHGGACYYEDYHSEEEAPKNNKTYRNWKSPYQLEKSVADGRCLKADSLEELVALVYPDDPTAQKTALAQIERYNQLAEAGYDADFNKPAGRMFPLKTAPFYADAFSTAIMLVCIGGLESDEECHTYTEVTDELGRQVAGDIIRGLYVAGNVQGGRFGMEYPIGLKGVSHSMAMYYGKVAAENAIAGI